MRSGEQKVLGVSWDAFSDQFVVDLDDIAHLAQDLYYNLLGFVSPIIIRLKMLFQELCEAKAYREDANKMELSDITVARRPTNPMKLFQQHLPGS